MAWVYLATDLKHRCEVAIKVLKPDLSASLRVDRFLEEIRTTARLQHPHILPLFDSGEAGDLLFCVMPFVDGESLHERIKRERQLPIDEAIRIRAGVTIGTPLYMSPEQAGGDETIGSATDIFSLACVLYEMPVGTTPYPGKTPQSEAGLEEFVLPVGAQGSPALLPDESGVLFAAPTGPGLSELHIRRWASLNTIRFAVSVDDGFHRTGQQVLFPADEYQSSLLTRTYQVLPDGHVLTMLRADTEESIVLVQNSGQTVDARLSN